MQIAGRFFKIKARGTSLTQELRGGSVTFLTVRQVPGRPRTNTQMSWIARRSSG